MRQAAAVLLVLCVAVFCATAMGQVVFNSASNTPLDEKQVLPQWVSFRPGDGSLAPLILPVSPGSIIARL